MIYIITVQANFNYVSPLLKVVWEIKKNFSRKIPSQNVYQEFNANFDLS